MWGEEDDHQPAEFQVSDYAWITSAIGNAYFSGLSFEEFWECVVHTHSAQDIDTAVDAAIKLKELISCRSSRL